MKAIEFKEADIIFAKNQPEYTQLPAFIGNRETNPDGAVIFCMELTMKERFKLLFGGKLWCSLLMFYKSQDKNDPDYNKLNPLTPSYFTVDKKDILTEIK